MSLVLDRKLSCNPPTPLPDLYVFSYSPLRLLCLLTTDLWCLYLAFCNLFVLPVTVHFLLDVPIYVRLLCSSLVSTLQANTRLDGNYLQHYPFLNLLYTTLFFQRSSIQGCPLLRYVSFLVFRQSFDDMQAISLTRTREFHLVLVPSN